MVPHPHDDGPVERGVSLSMPAAVETVAARRHPGRSRDGVLSKNPIDAVRRADSTLDARRVATFVTAESLC